MSTPHQRGLPLRPTLVSVVASLLCLGAGGVGLSAYLSSTQIVDSLFGDLARGLGEVTTQRTLGYLEPATSYAALTRELVRGGQLDTTRDDAILAHCAAAIEANPTFTWASFSRPDGTYLAAYRDAEGALRATIRSQDGDDFPGLPLVGERGGSTRFLEFTPAPADELGSDESARDELGSDELGSDAPTLQRLDLQAHRGEYDPRTRPWYQEAVAAQGEGQWVRPFIFASDQAPGFMYVQASLREDGTLQGVFAVEYEISTLSSFLATLRAGENGRVYLVTQDGLVVGHPEGIVTEISGEAVGIARAQTHPDPMLREAFGAGALERAHPLEIGELLAVSHPFPDTLKGSLDLSVLVVAPAEDFFGAVRQQGYLALGIAALMFFLAIAAGVFFSNRISSALRAIAEELERIGHFDLREGTLSNTSLVREVNEMGEVAERMKNSLRSFGKYVPRDLVQELIESGQEAELGGETREITVLFSDAAGFTTVAEQLEPDALVAMLADYLDQLSSAIQASDGIVDKYIGDAIMAFWGAPRALPEHALHACRAALVMRDRARALEEGWRAAGQPAFSTRIGVNTGEALVGNIGAPNRMNYTVMGDTVNLASRIEGLGTPYRAQVLLGETTALAVQDVMLVRPIDWVAVKGKKQGVLIHELRKERADASEDELEACRACAEGLRLYRERDFEAAITAFQAANAAFAKAGIEGDGPSEVMIERCQHYQASPPPEDWDGIFVRSSK